MNEVQEYKGCKYYRYPNYQTYSDSRYFKRIYHGKKRYLHRLIWEDAFGPIPDGCHIHHKDGDQSNNRIENLECLSSKEHAHLHMTDPKNYDILVRTALANGKASHGEESQRKRTDSIKAHIEERRTNGPEAQCPVCGAIFHKVSKVQKMCSFECKKWYDSMIARLRTENRTGIRYVPRTTFGGTIPMKD